MKIGSLYILNDTFVRYTGEGDKFELLRVDDNDNIVGTGTYRDFDPLIPRILWSTPPRIRRTYYSGDPIVVLRNGTFSILPRQTCFVFSYDRFVHSNLDVSDGRRDSIRIVSTLKLIRSAKYAECDANCKRATLHWLLISVKLGFPKDMRRLIGEHIWESRDAREWENPE